LAQLAQRPNDERHPINTQGGIRGAAMTAHASTIANALGVSRATVYRVLAEQTAGGD
jgi:hypothetical protein